MSFDVIVGSTKATSPDAPKDLLSDVKSDFRLGPELESHLNQPLSALPQNLRSVAVDCEGGPSFTAGDFTFSLTAGAQGRFSVMLGGDPLVTYVDEFDTSIDIVSQPKSTPPKPVVIPVPAGQAYVCVELEFTIGGGISASAPVGMVGICGSASLQDTFGNAFYRKCSPSDTLHDAIGAAFANYVLPFHPLTFDHLDVGDYLHHDFNACLKLSLGASIGCDNFFYGGQAKSDLAGATKAFTPTPLPVQPISADAGLSFNFSYKNTFEALLWKTDANTGHMHLYRAKVQDAALALHAGIGLNLDQTKSAATIATQIGDSISKRLPPSLGNSFNSKVLPKAASEISNGAGDACDKIAGWLKPDNKGRATLDVAIESTQQSFLLVDYTFNFGAGQFAAAWKTAIAGDFLGALATTNGGVTMSPGGGLEKLYSKKTSLCLNLFGQLNAQWSDAVISNSSLIYAGNNTFHLAAETGRQLLFQVNNKKREIDIYFAAQADLTGPTLQLGPIDLHCVLQAANNPGFGAYVAGFLDKMNAGPNTAQLVQSIKALAGQAGTTERLQIVFSEGTYSRLNASTITNGKPDNEAPDQTNYNAFETACGKLFTSPPANFSYNNQSLDYGIWRNWNIACTNQWPAPPTSSPDRTNPGSTAGGLVYLNQQFPGAGLEANGIGYTLRAAGDFMNLCADLRSLMTISFSGAQLDPWNQLLKHLQSIITNDVSPYFVAPVVLALTVLCSGGNLPSEIKGPAPDLTDKNSIAVTVTYS